MKWFRGRGGKPADASAQPGPIDGLQRGLVSSRRRMVAGACVAVLLLAGLAGALAWWQYDDAKTRAMKDLRGRVVAAGAIVDVSFAGQIATLDAMAKSPAVVEGRQAQMQSFFRRVNGPGSTPFTGGIGWIDRGGIARVANTPGSVAVGSLADRDYFRQVVATRKPFVSSGLIGRRLEQPIIVVAVPTFGPDGRLTGVLAGSILLTTVGQSEQALDLGDGNLQVIDRHGRLLLRGLAPVQNTSLVRRIRGMGSGVLSTEGLDGQGDDVVAFATSKVPGWVTVIDRPSSSVFAPARRALFLELGSVLAGVLLVLAILVFVARRARRDAETQNERARSWSGLTRTLASASTPPQVSDAVLGSLAAAFPNAVAVVGVENNGRLQVEAASQLPRARRIVESTPTLEAIAPLGRDCATTVPLERRPELRELYVNSGRRLRAVHCLPIASPVGEAAGTISLLSMAAALEPSEWALLRSFADQASHALERAWLFVHEHELAVRLQRSLLPERLPSRDGMELAGRYLAGGAGVEVGGDWYDAVRRPDGTVHLCVGDVSGKGIGAATVMSRQRHTFAVYARELVSPAEIVRRMLLHADGDEMITAAVVTADPYTGELAYSCVGHPPPLLLDRTSGEVTRLENASAPPLGVAVPSDVVEANLPLPDQGALVLYTDGLIERRGENIDEAIDTLGELIVSEASLSPDAILSGVGAAIGSPDDDVALLVVTLDAQRLAFEVEIPADPTLLHELRRRLRAWLARRGVDVDDAADVVLAVTEARNNSIEHAYRDDDAGPIRVSVTGAEPGGMLRAVVEDEGTWRDQAPHDRGLGILLMEHLMHSTDIETDGRGTRVTLERRVRVQPEAAPEYVRTAS
jgi:anti-sigma regulatory factor (Ser/Thr protein kinase)/GAF domain-containing protein